MSMKPKDPSHDAAPVSTVAAAAPALDLSVLEQITGGSTEMLRELLGDFSDMAGKLVAEMRAGIDSGDARAATRAAHTLKGSSGLIGAQALRFKCEALERTVVQQGIEAARDRLAEVEQIYAATALLIQAAIARAA